MSWFRAELRELKSYGKNLFCDGLTTDVGKTIFQLGELRVPSAAFGHDTDLPVPATPGDALPGQIQAAHDALGDTLCDRLADLGQQFYQVGERLVDIAEAYEWLDEHLS